MVDGKTLPSHPFDPTAPALSATVPFLTGTTATEVTFFANAQIDPIDDATFRTRVKELLRVNDAQADAVIAVYRKDRPKSDNIDLFLRMSTDVLVLPPGRRYPGGAEGRAPARRRSTCIATNGIRRFATAS